ncbi:hypothetical protein [Leptospirillum ferriphilum]|uniref:Uncharacterized protein n=1 Tax=Leptospirillum ferriphilum YSK TaxID=1441628 RepID=A0A059XYF2_9BACT|nr:hypothetical protein [Leptospirillum ferriphilum]AIA31943.1 hypothetical protein Y981_10750 [Leptospirillum ferriphilum YSK]
MTPSSGHASQIIRKGVSALLFLCLSAGLLSCGGGPEVASSTGHYLFISNSNGIYAFSIQTNNTLSPVSTSAESTVSNNNKPITGLVYVATPGGISAPTLYAIDGSASLYALPVNGSSLGSPSSVSLSSCSSSISISSLSTITASAGGNYLLVTYSNGTSSNYILALTLAGQTKITGCSSPSSALSSQPSGIAVDCAVSAGSPCNGIVTFQNPSIAPPQYFTWSKGNPSSIQSISSLSASVPTSEFVLFSLSTGYFYLFSPLKLDAYSVSGNSPTSNPISVQNTPSSQEGYSPCLDILANQIYLPVTNGSIYQMSIQTNGSIGGANQLWNLGDTPALDSIGTCAVED